MIRMRGKKAWNYAVVLILVLTLSLVGCASNSGATLEDREVIGMDMGYEEDNLFASVHGGVYLPQGTPGKFYALAQTLSEVVCPQWEVSPKSAANIIKRHDDGNRSEILLQADAPAQFDLIARAGTQQVIAHIQVHVTEKQFESLLKRASQAPLEGKFKKLLRQADKLIGPGEEMTRLYYELSDALTQETGLQ